MLYNDSTSSDNNLAITWKNNTTHILSLENWGKACQYAMLHVNPHCILFSREKWPGCTPLSQERLGACTPVSPERLAACKMKEEIMPDVVSERVLSKLEPGRLLNLPRWRSMFYLAWNFCLLKIWHVKQCTDNEQVSVLSWKAPVAAQTAQSGSEWGPSNPVLSYLTIERIPVSTQTQQISKRCIGPKRDNNFTCKHSEHMRGLIFLRVPWCTFFLEKIFPDWWN